MIPNDPDSHWNAPAEPAQDRNRLLAIGLAVFALLVFGGVHAAGKARGWW